MFRSVPLCSERDHLVCEVSGDVGVPTEVPKAVCTAVLSHIDLGRRSEPELMLQWNMVEASKAQPQTLCGEQVCRTVPDAVDRTGVAPERNFAHCNDDA